MTTVSSHTIASIAVDDKPVTLTGLIEQLERANGLVYDTNEQLREIADKIYGGTPPSEGTASPSDSIGGSINDQLNCLHSQLATLESRVARIRGE